MGWVQTKLSDSQQPTPSVPETGKPKPNTNASSIVMVESGAIKKIFLRARQFGLHPTGLETHLLSAMSLTWRKRGSKPFRSQPKLQTIERPERFCVFFKLMTLLLSV
jgi:hypothetical protein